MSDAAPLFGICFWRALPAGFGTIQIPSWWTGRLRSLVTNWDVSRFGAISRGAGFRIGAQPVPIVNPYADVNCMEVLTLINSWGHLENARRTGSAAEHSCLGVGDVI